MTYYTMLVQIVFLYLNLGYMLIFVTVYFIIIIIIILFVQNKMHIKHVNKISEHDNKALRSALTAALNKIIQ